MYCTVSYLPHTDFEHGFPRSSSLQRKVFHLKVLEMPHTEHKHHFQNVKENATTTTIIIIIINHKQKSPGQYQLKKKKNIITIITIIIIIIMIIIIISIRFSMKLYLLTDLEPTCIHCIWTMPSLNGDNSHNNWEALFLNLRDKNTKIEDN